LIAQDAEFIIGSNLKLNNRYYSNPLGGINKCTFFVDNNAVLILGNNVGISQSTIICCRKVVIGDNVKIGAGVKIFDSDFHSLNSEVRRSKLDKLNSISLPINIGDNVFIGAFSIILKGVDIGPNSIIAAGSVLSKSVPENQLWAGNPAKFVRDTV
jgi:acetyltransferase-like isoleucine patch superfamily enzyme